MNTIEVNVWLTRNKIKKIDIARELGVDPSLVYHVIAGRTRSRRVVEWLKKHGCPGELLNSKRGRHEIYS